MRHIVWILLTLAVVVHAEDIATTSGTIYSNVTVKRAEPDALVLLTAKGILRVPFSELPKDTATKFGYDETKAAEYQRLKAIAQNQAAEEASRTRERAKAKAKADAGSEDTFPIYAFDLSVSGAATTETKTTVSDGWAKSGSDAYWVPQPVFTTTKENKTKFTLKATLSNRSDQPRECVASFGGASKSEQLRAGESKRIAIVSDQKSFLSILCDGNEKSFPLP
jgi:hypothetical protein